MLIQVTSAAIKMRKKRGLSLERINNNEDFRTTRHPSIIVFGINYENISQAYKALSPRVSLNTIRRSINKGVTPDEAFTKVPNHKTSTIYLIRCLKTAREYVGETILGLDERLQFHIKNAQKGNYKNAEGLHSAINTHGSNNFRIEKLATTLIGSDDEKYWIEKLNTLIPYGYNLIKGGYSIGGHCKACEWNDMKFESVKELIGYVSEVEGISKEAARGRVYRGNINLSRRKNVPKEYKNTPAWRTYLNIVNKYTNPKSPIYRVLAASDDWVKGFEFFRRDMGQPPRKNMVITRLDFKKGYCKNNCKWVSKSEAGKLAAEYRHQKTMH